MKALLSSLLVICALMMVLAGSALAAQQTTPRADQYIEVVCFVTAQPSESKLASRSDINSLDGQNTSNAAYNLHAGAKSGTECHVAS